MSEFSPDQLRKLAKWSWALLAAGVLLWVTGASVRATGAGIDEYLVCMIGAGAVLAVVAVLLQVLVFLRRLGGESVSGVQSRPVYVFLGLYNLCVFLAAVWFFHEEMYRPRSALWAPSHAMPRSVALLVAFALVPWVTVVGAQLIAGALRRAR